MDNTTAPELSKDLTSFARCEVDILIDIKAKDFFRWYVDEPIENFMLGTLSVSPIICTEMLDGPKWGKVGSARKIFFKDKSTALEKILKTDFPHGYEYQPWAFTNPVRFLSDYALATMKVEDVNGKARVIWNYGFHAKNSVALPLLNLFVRLDWRRNMTNALGLLKEHLETHGTGKRMHEIKEQEAA